MHLLNIIIFISSICAVLASFLSRQISLLIIVFDKFYQIYIFEWLVYMFLFCKNSLSSYVSLFLIGRAYSTWPQNVTVFGSRKRLARKVCHSLDPRFCSECIY